MMAQPLACTEAGVALGEGGGGMHPTNIMKLNAAADRKRLIPAA
jgi:hypothetical protein